ncbi:dockerin type I domain-containing protein [Planctomycetota bacterium]
MTKKIFFVTVIAMTFSVNNSLAAVSLIGNYSFEDNNSVIDPLSETSTPLDWNDVNLPADKFGGYVDTSWQSDGQYCLTVYSERRGVFEADDLGRVSQQVYLGDVNEITFDLKLDTTNSQVPWNADRFSAVLLIDGNEVWDSNELTPVGNGEYIGVILVTVDQIYKDANEHTLSLGVKAHVSPSDPQPYYIYYHSRWDNFRFDSHCHGGGYLRADLNMDCYVDWGDVKVLAENWLNLPVDYVGDANEKVFDRCDLYEDSNDIINFLDYGVLINSWLGNSIGQESTLLEGDLNEDGIVNFVDFAILTSEMDSNVIDYNEVRVITEQWLEKSWIYWVE